MSRSEHPPVDVDRPRYDPAFQKIDVIKVMMDPNVNFGRHACDFTSKAFTRINPPYTLKRRPQIGGPQSQPQHGSSSAHIRRQGITTASPEHEHDPHDYLDPKCKVKWKHTITLLSRSSPTERESA